MDTLRIVGNGKDVNLYPWLNTELVTGVEALAGILGFGLAPVAPRWFEGAGAGSLWRGSRVLSRPIEIPLWVYAENRSDLAQRLSDLAILLDPTTGEQSRIYFGLADGEEWYVDVVREGGGDWRRKLDSDDRTYFKTTLILRAGDPYWTRNRPEDFEVVISSVGRGLLPELSKLQLVASSAFGSKLVENVGDAPAWPIWRIEGPATRAVLTGAKGEILDWSGDLLINQYLIIDSRANTIKDQDGVNRYNGLAAAPRFWTIAPGNSKVSVVLEGATPGVLIDDAYVGRSRIISQWWPRKWGVV